MGIKAFCILILSFFTIDLFYYFPDKLLFSDSKKKECVLLREDFEFSREMFGQNIHILDEFIKSKNIEILKVKFSSGGYNETSLLRVILKEDLEVNYHRSGKKEVYKRDDLKNEITFLVDKIEFGSFFFNCNNDFIIEPDILFMIKDKEIIFKLRTNPSGFVQLEKYEKEMPNASRIIKIINNLQ